jgi:aminoglycoside phosphotransferase (APT) family kinase protein
MELDEMRARLKAFMAAYLPDSAAEVTHIEPGPGHAGFSFLFDVLSGDKTSQYFIRLPPPGVKWDGTADVLRQASAVKALEGSDVPHAPILWSGDDLEWFDRPYFIQPRVDGDVLRGDFLSSFTAEQRTDMARQAMSALAGIHHVDPAKCSYLGDFWGFEFDVTRWDRFYERAAEPQMLALQPRVRELLLAQVPHDARIGLYHGDFQWANLMYSSNGRLLAVIDWELCGIGATLNDVGWICAFNDPRAWPAPGPVARSLMPNGDQLEQMYREAWADELPDIRWFKALAVYKFGIITGFNLMLHRRGKRHDPHWEEMTPGMKTNMEYALMMLEG